MIFPMFTPVWIFFMGVMAFLCWQNIRFSRRYHREVMRADALEEELHSGATRLHVVVQAGDSVGEVVFKETGTKVRQ